MELDDLHRLIVVEDQPLNAPSMRFRVYLDGRNMGELSGDSMLSYNMLPGRHRLELRDELDRSLVRDFTVPQSQHITRAFVRMASSGKPAVIIDGGLEDASAHLPGQFSSEDERSEDWPGRGFPTPPEEEPRRGAGGFFLRRALPLLAAFLLGAAAASAWFLLRG